MKISPIFKVLLLTAVVWAAALAQDKRAELVQTEQQNPYKNSANLYKGSYALVIGESNYTEGWRVLKGVSEDLPELRKILETHGFKVQVEKDLKRDDLKKVIDKFIGDYGFEKENRLLIYYAGHGHTLPSVDDRGDIGYIVPIDAPLPRQNEISFKQKAIRIDDFEKYAENIEAKHALFIFDSCFSGKLISRSDIVVPRFIQENVGRSVRQFITSGTEDQTVPDYSEFRRLFVRALEGDADEDGNGFILGSELGNYLMRELTNNSKGSQTPQYGKIRNAALDRGDFIFILGEQSKRPIRNTSVTESEVRIPPKIEIPKKQNFQPQTLSVSGFTKTDICVEDGTAVSITADGTISLGPNISETNPVGKDSFQTFLGITLEIDKQYYIEEGLPLGALLCRFDYSEKWNYCSTSRTITAEKKGCLILEVNDKDKSDNRGLYRVHIKPL